MAKRARPNSRTRKARQRHRDSVSVHKLIGQYERELKSNAIKAEADRLFAEIERLKKVIESGSKSEKLKAKSILPDRPNIGSSLKRKKGKAGEWVNVYQGGAPGLKK